MAQAVGDFTITNPGEADLYTFDFASQLIAGDSILSVISWNITVASGSDPADPNTYKVGDPTIFGTKVTQKCSGDFVPGVQYVQAAQVLTQFGLTPILWAFLMGEAIGC